MTLCSLCGGVLIHMYFIECIISRLFHIRNYIIGHDIKTL